MAASRTIASLIQKHSCDEIVDGILAISSERPQLREMLLTALHTASESLQLSADYADVARSASRASPRAWLRGGRPGGYMQERAATRIAERWSLVLLLIFNVTMLITVVIAYCLSIGSGRISHKDFYISSAVDTGWAHRVGALGITVGFVAYLAIMAVRYVAIKALLNRDQDNPATGVARMSKVAMVLEVCASFGAVGVGAFNYSFNYAVHMFFASITFFCAVAAIFLQTIIDDRLARHSKQGDPRIEKKWRLCRWSLCMLALLGLIGMFSFGPQGLPEYAMLSELVMAVALFSYFLTWLGSSGTGYIVGFVVFAYDRPMHATTTILQTFG